MDRFRANIAKYFDISSDILITLSSTQTWQFLYKKIPQVNFYNKILILIKFFKITIFIDCPHTNLQVLMIAEKIFRLPQFINGCVVETGAYKGGSTAKLSIIAKIAKRKLVVFDSFEGIPANNEFHSYFREEALVVFKKGSYYGSLREVKNNVKLYGELDECQFVKGLFDQTLPLFNEEIAVLFIDVDLISSTKSVLKYLYPHISKKGLCISHDGHLKFVVDLYQSENFWNNEVGVKKPRIIGLGRQKLLVFKKN